MKSLLRRMTILFVVISMCAPAFGLAGVPRSRNVVYFGPGSCFALRPDRIWVGATKFLWRVDRERRDVQRVDWFKKIKKSGKIVLPGDYWAGKEMPPLERMAPQRPRFYPMCKDPYTGDIWTGTNDTVPSIHSDYWGPDGPIGGELGGILRIGDKWTYFAPTGDLGPRAYSFAFDPEAVWVWGRYPGVERRKEGVRRYDRKSGRWTYRHTDFGYPLGSDILVASERYLWFGQSRMNKDTGEWVNFAEETGKPNSRCWVSAMDGNVLWLAYDDGDIVRHTEGTDEWERQKLPPSVAGAHGQTDTGAAEGTVCAGASMGTQTSQITSFAFTDRYVFAGLAEGYWTLDISETPSGLLVLDRSAGQWHFLTKAPRIGDLRVYALAVEDGTLWMGAPGTLISWPIPDLAEHLQGLSK